MLTIKYLYSLLIDGDGQNADEAFRKIRVTVRRSILDVVLVLLFL
jgi:hypothetical protein